MRLLIHAPNVHQGGGKTLLLALLGAARARATMVAAVVDARLEIPPDLAPPGGVRHVRPGVGARLVAEWRLRSLVDDRDAVLCFGNLPPLFGSPVPVLLFLQNRYLVRRRSTRGLPLRVRVRNQLERFWLRACVSRTDTVIVQTPSMAREVREELGVEPMVLPFAAAQPGAPAGLPEEARPAAKDIDFLYVASGEPHKNHANLLAAWALLAEEGIRPSLYLTVADAAFPELCRRIDEARALGNLKVENAGALTPDRIARVYARARAVIYPSRFESFGVPLLEAESRGLPVLAAELDYVRDLVDPIESFDPESPVSIARSVKRFLRCGGTRTPVMTPAQFLDRLAECVRGSR